jgi:hypothetical protein
MYNRDKKEDVTPENRKFYSNGNMLVRDYTANMNTYSSPVNGVSVNTLKPQPPSNKNSEV